MTIVVRLDKVARHACSVCSRTIVDGGAQMFVFLGDAEDPFQVFAHESCLAHVLRLDVRSNEATS